MTYFNIVLGRYRQMGYSHQMPLMRIMLLRCLLLACLMLYGICIFLV